MRDIIAYILVSILILLIISLLSYVMADRDNSKNGILEEVSQGVYFDHETRCYYVSNGSGITVRLNKNGKPFCELTEKMVN